MTSMPSSHACVIQAVFSATLLLGTATLTFAASFQAQLGSPEVILDSGQHGLKYFPDERLVVVRPEPDLRILLATGVKSVLFEGTNWRALGAPREVLRPGAKGEFDNGYAGISGAWRTPAGELAAIYHAEDQENMPSVGHGIPGFYCRVALAKSRDDGFTFAKLGPILTGHLAKNIAGRGDQGVGEPWVVSAADGDYLHLYYTSHERLEGRGVDICLARCPVSQALQTNAWKKYYQGGFTEPGWGGKDTPVITGAAPDTDAMAPHVVHVPALRKYVMLFCLNAWRENSQPKRSGIYAALSTDGIHCPSGTIAQLWAVPVVPAIGRQLAWQPVFIPDELPPAMPPSPQVPGSSPASGPSETPAALSGWIYYAYSESWGHQPPHKPHYLVRRRLELRFE